MKKSELCAYHYDPLDRLIGIKPNQQSDNLRFYCKSRLATEIHGTTYHAIMQHDDQLLAQHTDSVTEHTNTLFATDLQRSVLRTVTGDEQPDTVYAPYGHTTATLAHQLLGFNGERPEPKTGHYLLGNGYRAFNPVLMRFNSPDSWSPFGKAGINAYAYCMNNPVLTEDSSGHLFGFIGKHASNLASSLKAKAKNFFSGGVKTNRLRDKTHRLKIKPGISVSKAYKARDAMRESLQFFSEQVSRNAVYLNDLNTLYVPTLNLQATAIIKSNNIPTHTLPKTLQSLATNKMPNNPHYKIIRKIKIGDYDPTHTQPTKLTAYGLYDATDTTETLAYLLDLNRRAAAFSQEHVIKYHTLLDGHFIRKG